MIFFIFDVKYLASDDLASFSEKIQNLFYEFGSNLNMISKFIESNTVQNDFFYALLNLFFSE